jgi:hypothetical protein
MCDCISSLLDLAEKRRISSSGELDNVEFNDELRFDLMAIRPDEDE